MTKVDIHGFCDEKFGPILQVFQSNFEKNLEDGASVAVTKDGELVVDLWAGTRDREGTPWEKDTVVFVASGTKLAAGLCAHMCLDRGLLDLDEKVSTYWPEFGRHGKEDITVRMIFNHTAAIPGYSPPVPFATQLDWATAITALEELSPLWEPGTKSGYHGITYGHLVGELVRRVTGLTPGKFLKQEVTELTGIDFSIGFPRNQFHRMATPNQDLMTEEAPTGEFSHITENSFLPPAWKGAACLEQEIPSSNGMTNARGIAQLLAIYANDGSFGGNRFLGQSTIEEVLTEQFYDHDLVMGEPVRWGLGVGLSSEEFKGASDRCIHWGGRGGTMCQADLRTRTTVGYTPNRWLPGRITDPRNEPIRDAFIEVAQSL